MFFQKSILLCFVVKCGSLRREAASAKLIKRGCARAVLSRTLWLGLPEENQPYAKNDVGDMVAKYARVATVNVSCLAAWG